jgi:MFS family permease
MGAPRAVPQLGILSVAIVLGMAPWFAATVVAQSISQELALSSAQSTWLTLAVQLGFVVGSLVSALLLLTDRYSARLIAAICAAAAGAVTALLVLPGLPSTLVVALRFATGVALAGVYPPGIKMAAGWTSARRGTAVGVLVGAVTLGTAAPHLLRLFSNAAAWRPVLILAAASAFVSAVIFWRFTREGPYQSSGAPFDIRMVGQVIRERGVRLAIGGYLGHMWELYAMWSTIGLFLGDVVVLHQRPQYLAPLMSFVIIGVAGAIGCVGAGVWADRFGKSRVAAVAMVVSGICALGVGWISRGSFVGAMVVLLIWGITIVADSAQFSACVTVLSPPAYIGTAVTVQTAAGFLLTMLTIRLVPAWAAVWGWKWAYVPLALGPLCGVPAMWRLWNAYRV